MTFFSIFAMNHLFDEVFHNYEFYSETIFIKIYNFIFIFFYIQKMFINLFTKFKKYKKQFVLALVGVFILIFSISFFLLGKYIVAYKINDVNNQNLFISLKKLVLILIFKNQEYNNQAQLKRIRLLDESSSLCLPKVQLISSKKSVRSQRWHSQANI